MEDNGKLVVKIDESGNKKFVKLENLQEDFLKKQVEDGKSLNEITSDFTKAKVTSEIINGEGKETEKLHQELAKEQKETIKESFKQDRVEQQAKTLNAKQVRAEAFYVSFRPILEFDFSHLINKKEKSNNTPKEYKDRSYGLPLMCLMLALLVIPYCIFSIGLALLNGINAIFEQIATFSKVARIIAMTLFTFALMILIVYCAILGIDALFGTNIMSLIKF
jgi:hypothetical protein